MKSSPLNLRINPKKTHALLDRRYAERVPVHYRITYEGEKDFDECTGEGTLRDLSKTGCQVISLKPPALGSRITLTLSLPDGKPPLCLVGATVCRVAGHVCGVRFPAMASEERKRVQDMILKRVTLSGSARQRAAFRIV
jgi:c-di-GMP-binding flagellar brake protein YcgR